MPLSELTQIKASDITSIIEKYMRDKDDVYNSDALKAVTEIKEFINKHCTEYRNYNTNVKYTDNIHISARQWDCAQLAISKTIKGEYDYVMHEIIDIVNDFTRAEKCRRTGISVYSRQLSIDEINLLYMTVVLIEQCIGSNTTK